MSLLFDRLLFDKWKPFGALADITDRGVFQDCVKSLSPKVFSSVVVRADNVAKYFYEESPQESWQVFEDFPCIVPPFESTWLEWSAPKRVNNNGAISEADGSMEKWRWGCYVHRSDPSGVHLQPFADSLSRAKWVLTLVLFMEVGGSLYGPGMAMFILVDKDGNPFSHSGNQTALSGFGLTIKPEHQEAVTDALNTVASTLNPALLALSFMNCKNVSLTTQHPPEKLSRAHQKRRGTPLITFKTLEIEPMKKVLRVEGNSAETGIKKALHICRGHFATYEEGRGMFGKYSGRFWIPNHVRGSRDAGVVVKDYSIKVK